MYKQTKSFANKQHHTFSTHARSPSLIAREKQEEDEKENQEKIIRKVRLLSEYFHHLSHQRTDDEHNARQRIRKKIITTSTLFYIIFFSSMERICSFSTDSKKNACLLKLIQTSSFRNKQSTTK